MTDIDIDIRFNALDFAIKNKPPAQYVGNGGLAGSYQTPAYDIVGTARIFEQFLKGK
jgi:hypothetical protein